jgi:hypothetical protein
MMHVLGIRLVLMRLVRFAPPQVIDLKRVPNCNGAEKLDLIVSDGDEYFSALSTVTF